MLMHGELEPSGGFDVARVEPAFRHQARLLDVPPVFSCCLSSS